MHHRPELGPELRLVRPAVFLGLGVHPLPGEELIHEIRAALAEGLLEEREPLASRGLLIMDELVRDDHR